MAFLRVKKIKGNDYAYLVESRWDPNRKVARQRIIKYLGPATAVTLDDIPPEFQNEKVRAFILRNSVLASHRKARLILRLKERLLSSILDGSVSETRAAAREGLLALGVDQLYVDVVTPVMYSVGELWERREIYVSHEHLATNTMAEALVELNATIRWTGRKRGLALICMPDGERHKFAALLLQGLLLNRGYSVLDISDSAPASSVVAFVELRKPAIVLVSVTMSEHLPMARRLVKEIQGVTPDTKILLGGQAILEADLGDLPANVVLDGPDTLAFLNEVASERTP